MNQSNLRRIVFISLFTALIIIGSYLSFPIPFSPIPIVLSDFFLMLAGLCLGTSGVISTGLFLFLGAIGIPVFTRGKAGLGVFMGPTGGFLLGYLIGVYVLGLISGKGKPALFKDLMGLIAFNLIIFGLEIPWLKLLLKVSWDQALALGFTPFVIGNSAKTIAAVMLIQKIRPFLDEILKDQSRERSNEHS
ncbi:MAG TPA: biotin transporter BioY [Bacillota bacterium]